jgi:hypothetical protein
MSKKYLLALLMIGCTPSSSTMSVSWSLEVDGVAATCAQASDLGDGSPAFVRLEAVGRQTNQRGSGMWSCDDLSGETDPMPPGRYEVTVTLADDLVQLGEPAMFTHIEMSGDDVDLGAASFTMVTPPPCGAPAVTLATVYFLGGETGATFDHDFVVLRNRSKADYDLSGHSIQFRTAADDAWTMVALPDATIPARGYYLIELGSSGSAGDVVPDPDFTSTENLDDADDLMVGVFDTQVAQTGCPTADLIDLFALGAGAPCAEGAPVVPTSDTVPSRQYERFDGGCDDSDANDVDWERNTVPTPPNTSTMSIACSCP